MSTPSPSKLPHKRLAIYVVAGILLIALLAGAASLLIYVKESNTLRQGVQNGFELTGTYQNIAASTIVTFTVFHEEDDGRMWQLQDSDQIRNQGEVVSTLDPNYYLLKSADGSEIGWIHLAYSDSEGKGMLYLGYEGDELVELPKVGRYPTTIEPTVDSTQDTSPTVSPIESDDTALSTIAVFNAWGREGAAAQTCEKLAQAGYQNSDAKNAPMQDYPNSVVLFRSDEDETRAKDIARILAIDTLDRLEEGSTWASEYGIVVIIGQDAFGKVS